MKNLYNKIKKSSSKLIQSVFSNFAREATTSISQLLLTPLYISRFGATDYAIWLLLSAYTAFVVLSDFGLSTAVIVNLRKTGLYFDLRNIRLWQQFIRITFSIGALFGVLILGAVFRFFTGEGQLHHGLLFYLITSILFIVLAFQILQQHIFLYRMQIVDSYSKGMQFLFYIRICEVSVSALALYLHAGFIELLIINITVRAITLAVAKRNFSHTKNLERNSKDEVKQCDVREILKPAIGNGFIALSVVLGIHGSFVLAASWMNPTSLIALSLTRMLVAPIRLIAGALAQGSLPYLIALVTESDARKSIQFFSKYLIGAMFLISASTALVLFSSQWLWNFLAKGTIDYSFNLLIFFIASVILDALCIFRLQLPTARNQSLVLGSCYLMTSALSLILQLQLSATLNVLAVPVGIISADIFFLILSLAFVRRSK